MFSLRSHHRVSPWPTHNLRKSTSTNQRNPTKPRVSTNHVRVHAAHDREHGCYNSFTLYRGCTRYPWVVIILRLPNTHCTDEHSYTLPWYVPGNHYKIVQWFHLACNVPTQVSLPVWASYPPRSPLLCLIGSSHRSFTHTIPRFCRRSFTEHPSGLPSQLPRTAGWYAKTRLYHVLCQAIPI
jgi:hypothetical protein